MTEDLLLVNTSDTLPGRTEFINEVTVHGNLKVGGLIDGRNLSRIVEERVTLSGNQSIDLHLIFNDHVIVHGKCALLQPLVPARI